MKQEFIKFLNDLMDEAPHIVETEMTDEIKSYIEALKEDIPKSYELTEHGKVVLKFLQTNQDTITWKAKDVAEGLGISSRGVSGSFRKLVTDGFVEKMGKDPAIYCLTEKGKNFIIE